jgi:hypothetical protein
MDQRLRKVDPEDCFPYHGIGVGQLREQIMKYRIDKVDDE